MLTLEMTELTIFSNKLLEPTQICITCPRKYKSILV